jgi:acetyl-CoA synthetase
MRRRWEYWVVASALCKLGATVIPASLQLTTHDIEYRANKCQVKMMVCVADEYVNSQVEGALPTSPSIENRVIVGGEREGWLSFDELIAGEPETWERPAAGSPEAVTSKDIMLIYFTSGTTGHPKPVMHNYAHPLGHILTAKYWQQVRENCLHMSVTDSGWAKFGWGKIYGQWIAGATVFAYDMDKFVPAKLLQHMQDYKLTTFCAPPTMYRFMLQEDVAAYDPSSIQNFATAGEPLNAEVSIKWEKLTARRSARASARRRARCSSPPSRGSSRAPARSASRLRCSTSSCSTTMATRCPMARKALCA